MRLVVAAISHRTGMTIGKRQVEQMAARAVRHFDGFYALRDERRTGAGSLHAVLHEQER